MGIALCSFFENNKGVTLTSFILENKEKKIIKMTRVESPNWYLFHSLNDSFIIDENSFMYFNKENLARSEGAYLIKKEDVLQNNIKHRGLSYFFLAQINEDDKKFKLYDEVKLLKELDFTYLTPPVEIYKEFIELYLSHMYNTKVRILENTTNELKEQNKIL